MRTYYLFISVFVISALIVLSTTFANFLPDFPAFQERTDTGNGNDVLPI